MKFKILDTKWKRNRRLEIMLMILYAKKQEAVGELHFQAIYDLTIKALDLDWIHPNY